MNYFGTDGIRGQYGVEVTNLLAYKLGRVLGAGGGTVLLARDTRVSGMALLESCASGVVCAGGDVINLGILPTSAVGHFVGKFGGSFGVMISASHNPPTDNGLKVFDQHGNKIDIYTQMDISMSIDILDDSMPDKLHSEPVFHDIANMYCQDILDKLPTKLKGLNIALDCGYGASYKVAPTIFRQCGASVVSYCNRDSGDSINVNCGATHIDTLQTHMISNNCHLGFAMDGDSDRLAVLEGATVVDNNAVLLALARYMQENGTLNQDTVVGTTLTNSGLESALSSMGIALVRSEVGDSNIAQLMRENSYNLGGEDSGHYILSDYMSTSDAILVALVLCNIYITHGSIKDYSSGYMPTNSIRLDIDLSSVSASFATSRELAMLASSINNNYHNSRVVLRPSGTERKIRCYIEGENCQEIAQLISATIANR